MADNALDIYCKVSEIIAKIVFVIVLIYISVISSGKLSADKKIALVAKSGDTFLIARCRSVGRLSGIIAENVTIGVPLSASLDPSDADSDSLYIKRAAYSSVLLRMGDKDKVTDFQTDMILDCLSGKIDR